MERLATANRAVAAIESGTALVLWVNDDEGPGTFLATRAGNLFRAADAEPLAVKDVPALEREHFRRAHERYRLALENRSLSAEQMQASGLDTLSRQQLQVLNSLLSNEQAAVEERVEQTARSRFAGLLERNQAEPIRGDDLAIRRHRRRLAGRESQHAGDGRPEDIRVNESNPAPGVPESERQIDADRGLAHAALSAAHRDDIADPR